MLRSVQTYGLRRTGKKSAKSRSGLPRPAVSDRHSFAATKWETGLLIGAPEKMQGNKGDQSLAVRSLQSSLLCKIAQYRPFSHILPRLRQGFSAVQTAWRSGEDSNHWYRSERRKGRRLRKLQGINNLARESIDAWCYPTDQTSAVSGPIERRIASDSVAEMGHFGVPLRAKLVSA